MSRRNQSRQRIPGLAAAELRVHNALERIRRKISESGRRLAVLHDDPTGTQTVHGVPVLTTWSVEDLRWALEQSSSTFYILTNSGSFPEEEAARMNREISANLASAAEQAGEEFDIVSRSDSMGLVREAAGEQDFQTPLADAAHRLYEVGSSLGLGEEDDSGVVRVLEKADRAGRAGDSPQVQLICRCTFYPFSVRVVLGQLVGQLDSTPRRPAVDAQA